MKRLLLTYIIFLPVLGFYAQVFAETTYVDLGLPSGTKWAVENEERMYTFYEAYDLYPNQLPTEEQFRELRRECTIKCDSNGVYFIGKNGNSIYLPTGAYHDTNLKMYTRRYLWQEGFYLHIHKDTLYPIFHGHGYINEPMQTRLVKNPDNFYSPLLPDVTIDLDLPSGTLWMANNLEYTPVDSEQSIPLYSEWQELLQECYWEWTGKGYLVSREKGDIEKLYIPARTNIQPNNPSEFIYSHYRVNLYHSGISMNSDTDSLMDRYIISNIHYIERLPFEYVDMGLPSGTKWGSFSKDSLQELTWKEAIEKYGMQIPSIEQFKELFEYCETEITENDHFIVTAKNGNKIILNREYIWTRTEKFDKIDGVYCVMVYDNMVKYFFDGKKDKMSVHLVR